MRHVFLGTAATLALAAGGAVAQTELTLWSHWADQQSKVAYMEAIAETFEAKHPEVDVEITWYQKQPLYSALKAALQAGQGPDIFYCEPAQTEYVDAGFLLDLSDKVDWDNVELWAKEVWTFDGKQYAVPLEGFTVELYYNRDMMERLGVELGDDKQLDFAEFRDLVGSARAEGITPIVQGVGDRPYPGAYVPHELLLKKLGVEDYDRLRDGELSWTDPRVVETLEDFAALVEAGAYPESFSTLKLGESHFYFYQNPGGLMLPMGSWYTSRAFNPPEQGGQPEDFPLGIMKMPVPEGAACPECKTAAIGGSFCANADSPNAELAADFLATMAQPEHGTKWLVENLVQTGIKSDAGAVEGAYKPYFEELAAINADATYAIGIPLSVLKGQCNEVFQQVVNAALPAGQIDVDTAVEMLDAACHSGG